MAVTVERYADWAAGLLGGECISMASAGSGASRSTWLIDVRLPDGEMLPAVLRIDTGDGPLSNTEISLAREGAVYRALQDTGVPVATFHGISEDGLALVLGRNDGDANWGTVADATNRETICREFAEAFGRLHALDAGLLDIPGLRPVRGPRDHATNELDVWEGVLRDRVRRPAPIVRYAFDWMRRNAPECDEVVLCHGDVGPGNFMFDGARLTALIDLEFAHFGDPMDDLAWMNVRGAAAGEAWPLDLVLRTYAERSGRTLDRRRIEYYQAFVVLRMAVACLVGIDTRKGTMNANVYFILLPALEALLPGMLGAMAGVQVRALPGGDQTPADEVAEYIEQEFLPATAEAIVDKHVAARLLSVTPLVRHLRTRLGIGNDVEQRCLVAIAAATGKEFSSWHDAAAGLDDLVTNRRLPDETALTLLGELAAERARLWPGHQRMAVPKLPDWIGHS